MNKTIKIVGMGGSLVAPAHSLAALKLALASAAAKGAETELLDLGQLDIPLFSSERAKEVPADAQRMCDKVYEADALIWASPLYHGTVSGLFKNAVDWLELLSKQEPKYLTNKFVGLISTAGGTQGLQAINTMEYMVRALRGWTVPLVVPIARAWECFDQDMHLIDEGVKGQLAMLGEELVRCVEMVSREG